MPVMDDTRRHDMAEQIRGFLRAPMIKAKVLSILGLVLIGVVFFILISVGLTSTSAKMSDVMFPAVLSAVLGLILVWALWYQSSKSREIALIAEALHQDDREAFSDVRTINYYTMGQKWPGLGFRLKGSSRYHNVPFTTEEFELLAAYFGIEN